MWPFDEAEQRQTVVAAKNAAGIPPGTSFRSGVDFRIGGASPAEMSVPSRNPPPNAPVRVGGNIKTPVTIEDANPVMPEVASRAGIRGVVILEITIAADGRVSDARVLRNIPLLDAAAIDAVRKWRYAPTLLNGTPVPVSLTVTVNFP